MSHYLKNKNMKKYTAYILSALLIASPLVTFAAGKTLRDIIIIIMGYLSVFIYLIIGLAVVTFVWNVYRYFFTEKDKKEAGMYVLYSTIGFFVILSFWGLVAILTNSFKLDNNQPGFPFGGSTNQTYTDLPTGSTYVDLPSGQVPNYKNQN